MKNLIKNELVYLKGKGVFILALLIALEIVGLLLEDTLVLFFVSYFIFPAIVLEKYRNRDVSDINLFYIYIKMLVIYFLIIPIYLCVHVAVYKKIGFNIDNMIVINSIMLLVSSIFYGIQITLLKKHGAEKAGSMSLRIIVLVVISAVIIALINLLYSFLTVGRDLYIIKFTRKLFGQWILAYIFSMTVLSVSYFYGKKQYNKIVSK